MRKQKKLVYIAFTAIILTSCSFPEQGSESCSSASESLILSSASESSEPSSSDSSSATLPSSKERPPFKISSNSGYYTVSIYQCYLLPGKDTYGNPRFDFSVTVEAGQPLYSTPDELNDLLSECNEIYNPNGGMYQIWGLYSDEACKHFISYSNYPINRDMNAYYYCKC